MQELSIEELDKVCGASAWDDFWYSVGYGIGDFFMNGSDYMPTDPFDTKLGLR